MAEPIDLDADLESLGTLALRIADDRAVLLKCLHDIKDKCRYTSDVCVYDLVDMIDATLATLTVPQCFEPKREQRNG